MITRQEFEEFEKHWLMQVLKTPTYRYGQAFMNYFHNIDTLMLSYDSTYNLWEDTDIQRARQKCLEYVDD
jgi:hypothetical protein